MSVSNLVAFEKHCRAIGKMKSISEYGVPR
jgi:hypothetical protein